MPAITAEPVLAPGSTITLTGQSGASGVAAPAATAMLVGFADRGPVNTPVPFSDMTTYGRSFGTRNGAAATLYDSADVILQEGAGFASGFAARLAGPAATFGSLTDLDQAGVATVKVTAAFVGAASAQILRRWEAGDLAGTVTLRVFDTLVSATAAQETYKNLPDVPTAVSTVNAVSQLVTLTDLISTSPLAQRLPAVTATTALPAGGDDRTGAGDAQWQTAINSYGADFGPGLMLAPGRGTPSIHAMLSAAALATYRTAIYDAPDLPAPGDLVTLARTNSSLPGYLTPGDVGTLIGPWVTAPGAGGSSTARIVPASAALAGLSARNDQAAGNAGRASLGRYGVLRYCTGVHGAFTEADRDTIDGGPGVAGASVIRSLRAIPAQVIGFRTCSADPLLGYDYAAMRETAWIKSQHKRIADNWVGARLDGQGLTFKGLQGELDTFMTTEYNTGALYGAAKTDAFAFDTGPTVNTPATIAALRLKVKGWFKVAGTGFRVDVDETRRGITA